MPDAAGPGHVVLVGMMGSGKTTVGKRVARKLDTDFVDTDSAIVEQTGRGIAEWFSEVGEMAFRTVEAAVIAEILDRPVTSVVSTGGGAVLDPSTRELLADDRHTVVWLRAGPAFLASRLAKKAERNDRPLLSDNPLAALERLDAERRDLYGEVADIVIDIEPVMSEVDHPRRHLASLIVDTLGRTGVMVAR